MMSMSSIRRGWPFYQILERLLPRGSSAPISVRLIKRALDLIFAVVGLLLLACLLPIICLAIRLDSAGPFFYRQRRAGALRDRSSSGRCRFEQFEMLKFRSMRVDAEAK